MPGLLAPWAVLNVVFLSPGQSDTSKFSSLSTLDDTYKEWKYLQSWVLDVTNHTMAAQQRGMHVYRIAGGCLCLREWFLRRYGHCPVTAGICKISLSFEAALKTQRQDLDIRTLTCTLGYWYLQVKTEKQAIIPYTVGISPFRDHHQPIRPSRNSKPYVEFACSTDMATNPSKLKGVNIRTPQSKAGHCPFPRKSWCKDFT